MYHLAFQTGPIAGQALEVARKVLLVGGGQSCDLPLENAGLAECHARLEENGAGVFVSAMGPDCSLRCNGEPVEGGRSCCLHDGDCIELGDIRAVFRHGPKPVVPPRKRLRISHGLVQPLAVLACIAFLVFEIWLLRFLIVWPDAIYDDFTEIRDRAAAERLRETIAEQEELERQERNKAANAALALPGSTTGTDGAESGGTASGSAAAPGTNSAVASSAAVPSERASAATPAAAASGPASEATAAALEMLTSADFTPATPETELSTLPPISAADPRIADAQRVLAQAIAAAQFADYAEAERLFRELHRAAPGFLPTYEEHAKMLELQGHYSEALLRWRQLMGLAPGKSPFRAVAAEGIQRVSAHLGDKRLARGSDPPVPERTGIRLGETEVVRLADSPQAEVEEMRVLHTVLSFGQAPSAPVPGTRLRVVVDFFDRTGSGDIVPSPALVSVSPDALRVPSAFPADAEVNATYVVPRGMRRGDDVPAEYYGYRLRVFDGDRLLAEQAKPRRLLEYTEAP